jgi:hypothetical protein
MRQSGVYTERQVTPRPVRDMEAEKAQELMRLDVGVAYLYGRQGGVQVIRKLHIERLDDRFRVCNRPAEIEQKVLQNGVDLHYLKSRHEVEAELDQRRKQWQISPTDPPKPRGQGRSRKQSGDAPPPKWG